MPERASPFAAGVRGTGITLCADDYGLNGAISEAILALGRERRISATSAIVTTDRWGADARRIRELREHVAVGLHLNLTEGRPVADMPRLAPCGAFPSLRVVLARSLTGAVDAAELTAEIERQLDRFESEFGAPPDFLDGHQHVHALPGIRNAVVAVLKRRAYPPSFLLRDPSDRLDRIYRRRTAATKAHAITWLASGFRRLASQNGFRVNSGFSGFSTFGPERCAAEFDSFFVHAGKGHMVMCHPGLGRDTDSVVDPLRRRRFEEYAFLAGHPSVVDMIWHPDRSGGRLRWP